MVYGVLRFINFAHGDVFMLGAFAGYFFSPVVNRVLPAQSYISGAVVLETKQQFDQAGLTPVDPQSVPVVPEPGTLALLGIGLSALVVARWRKARNRSQA